MLLIPSHSLLQFKPKDILIQTWSQSQLKLLQLLMIIQLAQLSIHRQEIVRIILID